MMDRREFAALLGVGVLGSRTGALSRLSAPAEVSIDVRRTGAKGDGRTDDTTAVQRAVDQLPAAGGTVTIPPGRYLIDATRSIRLRDDLTLRLAAGATLLALPTGATKYAILAGTAARRVRIIGGALLGERRAHLPPLTGEWGMGIDLRGCEEVTVENVSVRECWGDGIYVGHATPGGAAGGECRAITLRACRLVANRRQGISFTGCLGALVERCEFIDTGGTPPGAGIDLEPNGEKRVEDVVIQDCFFRRNAGWGVTAGGAGVLRVSVLGNRFAGNGRGGIQFFRSRDGVIRGNRIDVHDGPAVRLDGGSTGNIVEANLTMHDGRLVSGGRLYVERGGAAGNRIRWWR